MAVEVNRMAPSLETKRDAVRYYSENNVPGCIEKLLNDMFLDKPSDVFGFMSDYFSSKALPLCLSKINITDILSPFGYQSLQLKLDVIIHGKRKTIITSKSGIENRPASATPKLRLIKTPGGGKDGKSKGDKKSNVSRTNLLSKLPKDVKFNFKNFKEFVTEKLSKALHLVNIDDNEDINKRLSHVFETWKEDYKESISSKENVTSSPTEVEGINMSSRNQCHDCINDDTTIEDNMISMSYACYLLSSTMNTAMANHKGMHLFQRISKEIFGEDIEHLKYRLPIPIIPILACGVSSPGKMNVLKELCIIPDTSYRLQEQIHHLSSLYHQLGEHLVVKYGVNGCVCDEKGIFTPIGLDKIESIFEIVQPLLDTLKQDHSISFGLILNIASSDFYDQDKETYEICTGMQRSATDMISMLVEIQEKYNIVAIIDPLSSKDEENLNSLRCQLSGKCYVFQNKDNPSRQNDIPNENRKVEDRPYGDENGCFCLSVPNASLSISDACYEIRHLQEAAKALIIQERSFQYPGTSDVLHLAIALSLEFIKVGPMVHEESNSILNDMITIEEELISLNKLNDRMLLEFPEMLNTEECTNDGDGDNS